MKQGKSRIKEGERERCKQERKGKTLKEGMVKDIMIGV